MKDDLLDIYNFYGKSHQVSKLLEEVGELIETIILDDKINMEKEYADVLNVLEQFKYNFDLNDGRIHAIRAFKIGRQLRRIDDETTNSK